MGKRDKEQRQGGTTGGESPRAFGLDAWIGRHATLLLMGCLGVYALLALLNFDAKVSLGGDDSWYVMAAYDFWQGEAFPTWHGAFYSILLSPLVALLGVGIPFLKALSVLMVLGAMWLFGRAFAGRIRPVLWLSSLFLWAISHSWVVLGSTTYSEPLFMLLEMGLLYGFLNAMGKTDTPFSREGWKTYALLGVLSFLLALTRNVGWGAVIAIVLFLLIIQRDGRKALGYVAWVVIFQLPFSFYKYWAWSATGVSFGGQLDRVLQVDFYNASAGMETPWGMCVRFAENAYQYLSYHSLAFAGWDVGPSWVMTVLLVALGLYTLVWAWRRDSVLAFLGIYLAVMLGVTFITQQVSWGQERLVIVYFPLLFLFLFGWLVSERTALPKVTGIGLLVFAGIGMVGSLKRDFRDVSAERLSANMRGDEFYGLSPDWAAYLRMARWVGENLPDSAVVMCRKPNNARVYAGRKFFPLFKLPTTSPDSARMYLDSNHVQYVMAGRLRKNPEKRTDAYLNAVHVLLSLALYQQPDMLELVHREGRREPTVLLRIHRDAGSGTNAQVRKRLETAYMIAPENYEVLHKLAVTCLRDNDFQAASRYADMAIRSFAEMEGTEVYPLYEAKGMALFASGEVGKAITLFEYCTRTFPSNPHPWYNLGVCLRKAGQAERAAGAFREAEKLGGGGER